MSALATRRGGARGRTGVARGRSAPTGGDGPGTREPTLFDDCAVTDGAPPTLDALVSGVWEDLRARRSAPCPLCGGEMAPVDIAQARVAAGRCGDCGSVLS